MPIGWPAGTRRSASICPIGWRTAAHLRVFQVRSASPAVGRRAETRKNKLVETGNFKQEAANFLTWSGTGVGASKRSNSFVTIRNQNSAETTAGVNSQSRTMQADLATNIDLGQNQDTYVTFLVRENTAPLIGGATGVEQSNAVARVSE